MSLLLALRLVLRGDATGRVRLLLMSGGVALGVALLLGVTGTLPASVARQDVLASRWPAYGEDAGARTQGVAGEVSSGFWRGRELRTLRVAVVGPPVTPPAGVPALPGDGEVLVSPALADALRGRHGSELAARIPGRVVGTIGARGLTGPDELFLVARARAGEIDSSSLAPGFTRGRSDFGTTDDKVQVAVLLAGVALVVPILVLIGTSTRLSAASRERRIAAMRLLGASARQVARLAVVEGAVVGLIGAAAGVALFLVLRAPVGGALPVPDGVHAATVAPSARSWVVVLLGVPLLSAVMGTVSLRRVVTSPLGVTRQARATKAGPVRLVPLAAGLGLLLLAYAGRAALLRGSVAAAALLMSGATLTLVGIVVAGAALSRAGGLALSRWGRGPASLLAGRRLVLDPAAAARTVTGTALVVAVGGWVLAFLPLLAQAEGGYLSDGLRLIQPGTVFVSLGPDEPGVDLSRVAAVDGVRGVLTTATVDLLRPGTSPRDSLWRDVGSGPAPPPPLTAVVADCGAMSAVLRSPLPGCRPGEVQLIQAFSDGADHPLGDGVPPPTGRLRLLTPERELQAGAFVDVPAHPSVVRVPIELGGVPGLNVLGTYLVPPAMVRATALSRGVLVGTDGRPEVVEAVRTALARLDTYDPPLTPAEALVQVNRSTDAYRTAAYVGLVAVVVVGGLTLAVSTSDGLRERRRPHAALIALGTPLTVLRRSVLLQVATPLVLSVGLALAAAALASSIYLRLGAIGESPEDVLPLPWVGYGLIGLAAIVATLLATAAALPLVRSAARPDALRAE